MEDKEWNQTARPCGGQFTRGFPGALLTGNFGAFQGAHPRGTCKVARTFQKKFFFYADNFYGFFFKN